MIHSVYTNGYINLNYIIVYTCKGNIKKKFHLFTLITRLMSLSNNTDVNKSLISSEKLGFLCTVVCLGSQAVKD